MSSNQPPALLEISVDVIAAHIDLYKDLSVLPEELCCLVFSRVLELGRLNPKVLAVFQNTQHELLLHHIKGLKLRDTPVLVPDTRNGWLGDKPNWF